MFTHIGTLCVQTADTAAGQRTSLRDVINIMQTQSPAARDLLARMDPAVLDMLRAIAAHRRIAIETFAAEALTAFALDAADTAWEIGADQHAAAYADPEAALLGHLLTRAMRQHLRAGQAIAAERATLTAPFMLHRVGHPYGAA